MLWAAAAFDLRQHFIHHGIFCKSLAKGRIQALQQIRHRFIVPTHECDANFLSLRGQGSPADGRYLTDRYLTARVVEEGLDMLEGRDG